MTKEKEKEKERVLIVDDQVALIDGVRRQLRREFTIVGALSGQEAIEKVESEGPFAVVVSDMQMPRMNGVELLQRLRHLAPDTTRMMMTGNADMQTAIDAVNDGFVFRFLVKPCSAENLTKAIRAGISQYRLLMGQKELLERTLYGSIGVLCEMLSIVHPEIVGRSSRIQRHIKRTAERLGLDDVWKYEMAGMLSHIGCVILPKEILQKMETGTPLTEEETQLYAKHASTASDLLSRIPRMEEIARMILYQDRQFDGAGGPDDSVCGADIPMGSRLLKVVLDYDALERTGMEKPGVLKHLQGRQGWYDPEVLEAFNDGCGQNVVYVEQRLQIHELREGMALAEEICTPAGALLVAKGLDITETLIAQLRNCQQMGNLGQDVLVLVPDESASPD